VKNRRMLAPTLEQGAVECLFQPFSETALLEAVRSTLHPKWEFRTLLIVRNKTNATCEFAGQLRASRMAVSTSIVFVAGDDISVRESLEFLLRNEGWQAEDRPPSKFNLSQPAARTTSFS